MKHGPEVEAKYRLAPGQRAGIVALLGKPARVHRQLDVYFDVPGRVLRVRWEDGIKSRLEVEIPLPAGMAPMLEDLLPWLGHRRLTEVRKERHEYDVEGFTVCLDRVEGLEPPDFVEIESAGGDLDALRALRDRLGLASGQVETRSYARMVSEATKR
jgi:adenylate cyclase class IV